MHSMEIEQILQIADRHHQANELPQALALCEQILRQQPANAGALHLLGILTAKSGRTQPAIELIQRAILARPGWAQAHYHLGNLFHMTGQRERAADSYRQAIALKPDYLQAYNNLGVTLRELGKLDDALAALAKVLTLNPTESNAYTNMGTVYKDQGDLIRSATCFREAILFKSDSAEAYNNLAAVLRDMGQIEESLSACRRAVELQPHFAEAHNNLGTMLEESGQLDEASVELSQAIALRPDYDQAHYNFGNVLKSQGRVAESIASYRRAITIQPGFIEAHNNLIYTMHFHPDYEANAILEELSRWNYHHAEPLQHLIQPHSNDCDPKRRLRIGYVSPDLKEHPVGRFLLPLLSHHDETQFEIYVYSLNSTEDQLTGKLRSFCDTWRDITAMKDSEAAALIREDRIDILIDLTMHMARNRLRLFARKPAPIQLSWLAYCSTTGLNTIDFRLSDPHLDPPGVDDSVYSETTVRLPSTYWCYQPVQDTTALVPNLPPARANGFITFGSLNNFAKVSDSTIDAWTSLMQKVGSSRLLLHAHPGNHRQHLLQRFQHAGIHCDRIRFTGKLPVREYLKLHNQIDLALDTFPYAGGTTTCDALWMGVPVVTLAGKTAVGRGGVSILSNIGLPTLIARSTEHYIEIACTLASDLPGLSQLRSTLRERMEESALMDAPHYAQDVEVAFRSMWQTYCRSH